MRRYAANMLQHSTRRATIILSLLSLLSRLSLLSLFAISPAVALGARPNILWITCEDLSPHLGCYGDPFANTPHLDRLAKESIRYAQAFATAPVCSPVRSSLITGVYATSLGTANLRSRLPIPSWIRGFPSYLRAAGYYATNNVKTDYNTQNEPAIIAASWDENSTRAHWRGRQTGQPFFCVFNDMTTHQSRTMVWPYKDFEAKVASKLKPDERHDPTKVPVPPYYPDTPIVRRTLARYYDCIRVMDKNVGRRLAELKEDGLADDTIVFFFSDHGSGLPRHKRIVLDSGLRVPLLIRFPKKYRHWAPGPAGTVVERLVSFIDFPPTVLRLAGVDVPEYMAGRVFLGRDAAPPREFVFAARDRVDEAYDLARAVRGTRFLYVRTYMPHLSYNQPSYYSDLGAIRGTLTRLAAAGRLAGAAWHYAGPSRAREELYDTVADPHNTRNLAASPEHVATLEKLRSELNAWIERTADLGFLPESDVMKRAAGKTPYQIRQTRDAYPLRRIARTAALVGGGVKNRGAQAALLADRDPAVRYWAACGLVALGVDAAPAASALEKALEDPAGAVRIEAATALVRLGRVGKALTVLQRDLAGGDQRIALRAARALQLLGDRARAALPAMRRVYGRIKEAKGDPSLFLRFALEPTIARLEKRIGPR